MATSRQTIIEIKVPPKAVGTVIGRQGAMIKEVRVTKTLQQLVRPSSILRFLKKYLHRWCNG